jgi:hypothetical protein
MSRLQKRREACIVDFDSTDSDNSLTREFLKWDGNGM